MDTLVGGKSSLSASDSDKENAPLRIHSKSVIQLPVLREQKPPSIQSGTARERKDSALASGKLELKTDSSSSSTSANIARRRKRSSALLDSPARSGHHDSMRGIFEGARLPSANLSAPPVLSKTERVNDAMRSPLLELPADNQHLEGHTTPRQILDDAPPAWSPDSFWSARTDLVSWTMSSAYATQGSPLVLSTTAEHKYSDGEHSSDSWTGDEMFYNPRPKLGRP